MCGFAGIFSPSEGCDPVEVTPVIERMSATLTHRGPDDSGTWVDAEPGIALGFRRLAILDLSSGARQPMVSRGGRYVIAYNGEVYNFRTLRAELEAVGHVFETTSDTEVVLAAIVAWTVGEACKRFEGMFAFALWDREAQKLTLGRDRFGEKPLYYGWLGRTFVFGSELKAIRAYSAQLEIDRDVLSLYLRYGYIPAPWSIYKSIYKLQPATLLEVSRNTTPTSAYDVVALGLKPYWSLRGIAEDGVAHPFNGSLLDATRELDRLLREAVTTRMISDVPVGAFLSGGIDSSAIVALMQATGGTAAHTFSIGFHEKKYNEAVDAKRIAAHLGTNHTELYVTSEEATGVIPKLPHLYDEPFGDSSQIPTYLVAELARRDVVVSLSGDGGDELFGGYNRYTWAERLQNIMKFCPAALRSRVSRQLNALSPASSEAIYRRIEPMLPSTMRFANPIEKLQKIAATLSAPSPRALYRNLFSIEKHPERVVLGSKARDTFLEEDSEWPNLPHFIEQMMYMDSKTYLPDDILVKVDRATMGVGLESRTPYLDHRVAEFAWSLPMSFKVNGPVGKVVLREVLHQYIPKAMFDRPKMGFGIPIDSWLRGPLKAWAGDLLSEDRVRRDSFFDVVAVRKAWDEHMSHRKNVHAVLWNLAMFQAWFDAQGTSVT